MNPMTEWWRESRAAGSRSLCWSVERWPTATSKPRKSPSFLPWPTPWWLAMMKKERLQQSPGMTATQQKNELSAQPHTLLPTLKTPRCEENNRCFLLRVQELPLRGRTSVDPVNLLWTICPQRLSVVRAATAGCLFKLHLAGGGTRFRFFLCGIFQSATFTSVDEPLTSVGLSTGDDCVCVSAAN